MPPWYALHVASCTEALVSAKLADSGIEAYYPFATTKSKRLYRPAIAKVYFPGYVFARFDLAYRLPVIQISQVIRVLGWGSTPAEIPAQEIEALRTMTASPLLVAGCPYIPAGSSVRIASGPLAGIQGIVMYSRPGKFRIVVSVTMLQQSISAEVDADSLEVLMAA